MSFSVLLFSYHNYYSEYVGLRMVVLASVKVGRNYRITLPKEVRDHLNLDENSEILFFTISGEKGRICCRKIEA